MKIIKPSFEILTPISGIAVLKHLEACGRVCYKSESKTTEESCIAFVKNLIKRGHKTAIEHFSISVRFVCDKGVSHEILRYHLASYCQESTRYCNYAKGGFNDEISVIEPLYLQSGTLGYEQWKSACEATERAYYDLLTWGCTPQEARAVLPNSLKTEIVMTVNLREWRRFLKSGTAPTAHPQMRELVVPLLEKFKEIIPVIFDDIGE